MVGDGSLAEDAGITLLFTKGITLGLLVMFPNVTGLAGAGAGAGTKTGLVDFLISLVGSAGMIFFSSFLTLKSITCLA